MTNATIEKLLTAGDVCEVFGVVRRTTERWARDGVLPAVKLPTGAIRFRREDVVTLINRSLTTSGATSASRT